jgi:tetratricopeptide (TPR) repeat protein
VTDVLISYAREDVETARVLVDRLRRKEYRVWWDEELGAGDDYSAEILKALEAATVVVVLWSRASIESGFVSDEANVAKADSKLVPVTIDDVEPPLGFRWIHAQSLVGWDGDMNADPFQRLCRTIANRTGGRTDDAGGEASDEAGDEVVAGPARTAPTPLVPGPAPPESQGSAAERDAALELLLGGLAEAQESSPSPDSDLRVLRSLVLLAEHLARRGDHDDAAARYESARRVASNADAGDWGRRIDRGLGRALIALGRRDDAIEILRRTATEPDEVHALLLLMFERLDEIERDNGLSPQHRYERSLSHLMTIAGFLQRGSGGWLRPVPLGEAIGDALRPTYVEALAAVASMASDVGDHARAIELYEEAIMCATPDMPDWPASLTQLAHAYVAVGDERQAPGTDEAHREALTWYELADEILDALDSAVARGVTLRRCAEMALALEDTDGFERYEATRAAIADAAPAEGEQADPREASGLGWPPLRVDLAYVRPVQPVVDGEPVRVAVGIVNHGSLSWRGGAFDVRAGITRPGGQWTTTGVVEARDRIPPGAIGESPAMALREHDAARGDTDVFVERSTYPWEGSTQRVTGPLFGADG